MRTLLAALALSAGKTVSIERLAEMVWSEGSPANSRRSLQNYAARLRSALGGRWVETRPNGFLLRIDADDVDALRFGRILDEAARARDPHLERRLLDEALALSRGEPFEDVASHWLQEAEAPRLVERYLVALERRVDLDLAAGRSRDLVAELKRWTARCPLRESLWLRLLMVLDRQGRRAEALELYEELRIRLAEELGVDPNGELQRLHAELLVDPPVPTLVAGAGVPHLRVIPRMIPAAHPETSRGEGPRGDAAGGEAPPEAAPTGAAEPGEVPTGAAEPEEVPPGAAGLGEFDGRSAELAVLSDLARTEAAAVALVTGPAGCGKTAMAVHWARSVAEWFTDGQLYLDLRGSSESPVEPATALRTFLVALGVPPDNLPAPPENRPSDLDALARTYRTLTACRRVLVVLDDARDADQVRPLLPAGRASMTLIASRCGPADWDAMDAAPVHLIALQDPPAGRRRGPVLLQQLPAGPVGAPPEPRPTLGAKPRPRRKWASLADEEPIRQVALAHKLSAERAPIPVERVQQVVLGARARRRIDTGVEARARDSLLRLLAEALQLGEDDPATAQTAAREAQAGATPTFAPGPAPAGPGPAGPATAETMSAATAALTRPAPAPAAANAPASAAAMALVRVVGPVGRARQPQPRPFAVPRQLPADVTDFVGRADELALLDGPVEAHPEMITLVEGMVGVGKTALAVHAAHRLAASFPDGQLFVSLHGHSADREPVRPQEALRRMLSALGVPVSHIPHPAEDQAGLLRSLLADRRVLIVLDDAADENQVLPLLPGTRGCRVLVTSRRRLAGLDGTRTVSLDVLPTADAITLFTRAAGPRRVTGTPAQLLRTVRRCGLLPLAIRLAATRLSCHPTWDVARLLARLTEPYQRLTELAVGSRSLAAAVDQSYRRLPEDQRRAYRLLGSRTTADISAAAAAALLHTDVLAAERLLEQLAEAHLLREPAPGLYRMHELLRDHATQATA
ncbi:MAG TPA: BTAD domain-containing putative transcriptional regulator, partial [Nonomuraea sp.]|nr:BTAD domain-containing putative transcriptional regulator [Nonomuraea sp.]